MAVGRTAGAELDTVAAVDTAIAALPLPVLFATDIDGTLSEIVEVPDDARLLPGALDALWFLSLSGRVVAVISGRPYSDLIGLFGLPEEFALVGSHGAEHRGAVGLTPDEDHRLREVKRIFAAVLPSTPGAHIEHKPVAAALHVRRTPPALAEVAPTIAPGRTEAEIRNDLERLMREFGAAGPSYDTIVATGPVNAPLPHHRPTSTAVEAGHTVIIDVGALVDGYHSDMTRTFVIGEPSALNPYTQSLPFAVAKTLPCAFWATSNALATSLSRVRACEGSPSG